MFSWYSADAIQTFRQRGSVSVGVLGCLVCLFFVVSALSSLGHGLSPAYPAGGLVAAVAFWVFLVRPSVKVRLDGVTLENPLRHTTIPWGRIEGFGSRWNLSVDVERQTYSSWAINSGADRPRMSMAAGLRSMGGGHEMREQARHRPLPRATSGNVASALSSYLDDWEHGALPGQSNVQPGTDAAVSDAAVSRVWNRADLIVLGLPVLLFVAALIAG